MFHIGNINEMRLVGYQVPVIFKIPACNNFTSKYFFLWALLQYFVGQIMFEEIQECLEKPYFDVNKAKNTASALLLTTH